jgi:toxin YoeB
MIAANYTEFRTDLKKYLDQVVEEQETLIINRGKGKGKPEPLKYDLTGFGSRRIDREHRLVYQVRENEILVYSCRFHYDH